MGTLVPIKNPLSTNGAVLYHITANRLITLKTVHMICHQRKGAMLRGEGGREERRDERHFTTHNSNSTKTESITTQSIIMLKNYE